MAAPTIDWGSKVISVPKSFLTLIAGTSYSLDTNAFHIALKDLEDSEEGVHFPPTHNHNTVVLLGGIEYARIIEVINGYSITFEDGVYSVSLVGSNNNILDVVNLNQVSIRANNSAGLINVSEVQQIIFGEQIHLDVVNGKSGTLYPKGTPLDPVNNLADALAIAASVGLPAIHLMSDLTITTGTNIDGITIQADTWPVVTVEAGVSMENSVFKGLSLYGVMGGVWNVLIDCWIYDITNFSGWVRGGSIESVALAAGLGLEFGGQSFFDNLVPMYPGTPSSLTANTNTIISVAGCSDILTVKNLTAGSLIAVGLYGGRLIVDATCTGGAISVSAVGTYANNSVVVVDDSGLTYPAGVSSAVRTEITPELAQLTKVSKIHGVGVPLVVTPTSRVAGDLSQTIGTVGDTTTVSAA
jgi:hypothetical protein